MPLHFTPLQPSQQVWRSLERFPRPQKERTIDNINESCCLYPQTRSVSAPFYPSRESGTKASSLTMLIIIMGKMQRLMLNCQKHTHTCASIELAHRMAPSCHAYAPGWESVQIRQINLAERPGPQCVMTSWSNDLTRILGIQQPVTLA
jgi:hypothetical protein